MNPIADKQKIVDVSHRLAARGWVPATSGNFSARLDDQSIAITASGKDKSLLTTHDVLTMDLEGTLLEQGRPSAETELHLQLYRRDAGVKSVLHTHSVNAVWCSMRGQSEVYFQDLEILKAFAGVETHEATVTIPVFENTQDMAVLAKTVDERMDDLQTCVAYLIRGHGLYTWGVSVSDTMRHLEALEYLFDYYRLDAMKREQS